MPDSRWSPARARAWYDGLPWLVGCNFVPSTASNQLEMWQAATFDEPTLARELSWAAGLGMNAVRVYLHDLVWASDANGFADRIDRFLALAARHGLRTLLVLFDDCWQDDPRPGPQEEPIPGVHGSRWAKSPGTRAVRDRRAWPRLEAYVRGVVRRFGQDERVLAWDVYNEVGNHFMPSMAWPARRRLPWQAWLYVRHVLLRSPSLDLLDAAFGWARAERPEQPLTAPIYHAFPRINRAVLAQADVVSFHHYEDLAALERQIAALKALGRPVLCTEWLARPRSVPETHLPTFRRERVGCFCWGLVAGRTNTIHGWRAPSPGGAEPPLWFHDLLRPDGTPYRAEEAETFRRFAPAPFPAPA